MCLGDALKLLGVDNILDKDKLPGVENKPVLGKDGTGGAAVNVGGQCGSKAQLHLSHKRRQQQLAAEQCSPETDELNPMHLIQHFNLQ